MKLNRDAGSVFFSINNGRPFAETLVPIEAIQKSLNFAYDMVYGTGHHRSFRSGGSLLRKRGEKFCNTMQGKIAEIVLIEELKSHGLPVGEVDLGVYGRGIWDESDVTYKDKAINVKSCAHFSNLLLLEAQDYDSEGNYLPNSIGDDRKAYDYFVMVRIKPDLKRIFKQNALFYSDNEVKLEFLEELAVNTDWRFDIPGFISSENFKVLVQRGYILPKNSYLNSSTKMDADNYYIQAGNLRPIRDLVADLSAL